MHLNSEQRKFIVADIQVEVAYALPDQFFLKKITLAAGCNVQSAILQSGILQQFTDIDLRENKVGIFSRPAKLSDLLNDGDRVEIYRPLLADPKEIRRKRAEQQQQEQKQQREAEKQAREIEKQRRKAEKQNEENNDK